MILIVGDPEGNRPTYYQEAHKTAQYLKEHKYEVKELYRGDATSKNILKGMHDADGIIFVGQGGGGTYNLKTGIATGPYGLTGADKPILGYGNKMREGRSGPLFTPPFKKSGIPVIIVHACYSTGQTKGINSYDILNVKNRTDTVYNYSHMFTAWNANYLATLEPIIWDTPLIDDFVKNKQPIGSMINHWPKRVDVYFDKYDLKNNTKIWARNGESEFFSVLAVPLSSPVLPCKQYNNNYEAYTTLKDPNSPSCYGRFPNAHETTPYDDAAAEDWYNSHTI
jgi:hypothetical protein